jgi:phosphatidate cytidylyltransferase
MKRVLTAVVLIPVVLLLVLKAPLWLFALAVAGIIVLALHEYLNIMQADGMQPFTWLTYALSLFLVYRFWAGFDLSLKPWLTAGAWWMPLLLTPVLFGIPLVFRKDLKAGLGAVASSGFGIVYIAGSLSLLVTFRETTRGLTLLVFVLFSVWVGDIAAYYVGRAIGRHKLAPIVSPNKSWEGAIASVLGSVGVAFVIFGYGRSLGLDIPTSFSFSSTEIGHHWLGFEGSPLRALMLGIVTNIAAQFGDLFESALKRGAGVKDSGTLLPGHGGILDRIDALLFAIPIAWYYAILTGFPTTEY